MTAPKSILKKENTSSDKDNTNDEQDKNEEDKVEMLESFKRPGSKMIAHQDSMKLS